MNFFHCPQEKNKSGYRSSFLINFQSNNKKQQPNLLPKTLRPAMDPQQTNQG